MNVTDSIHRVSVVSTGQVQIRPDHLASTWRPAFWWLLASRRWTGSRPVNAYVIEHRDGLVLFDTGHDPASVTDPGFFPRRNDRVPVRSAGPVRDQPAADPQRRTGADRLRHRGREDCGHFPPAPGPHRRPRRAEPHRHRRQPGGVGHDVQPAAGDARADAPPQSTCPACAGAGSSQSRPTTLAWPRSGRVTTCSKTAAWSCCPPPGHTPGSISLLVRRTGRPPLIMTGDLTCDARLLETGRVPGVGSRRRLRQTTAMVNTMRQRYPGLVLPAHNPGAAGRLAQATGQAPTLPSA